MSIFQPLCYLATWREWIGKTLNVLKTEHRLKFQEEVRSFGVNPRVAQAIHNAAQRPSRARGR